MSIVYINRLCLALKNFFATKNFFTEKFFLSVPFSGGCIFRVRVWGDSRVGKWRSDPSTAKIEGCEVWSGDISDFITLAHLPSRYLHSDYSLQALLRKAFRSLGVLVPGLAFLPIAKRSAKVN